MSLAIPCVACFFLTAATAIAQPPSTWKPLGSPIAHDNILATSITFSPNSTPYLALGTSNSDGGTTTRFYNITLGGGSGGSSDWVEFATHTPQFPQPYEHFTLSVEGEAPAIYLGLVINPSDGAAAGLSSVLRNAHPVSGEDGFEGCYAFEGTVYDFAITPLGDMRLVQGSGGDNKTLELATYGRAGWDGYPAGDAWGPFAPAAKLKKGAAISSITTASDRVNNRLFVLFGGESTSEYRVGVTTLSNSTYWSESVGAPPFPAILPTGTPSSAALVWAPCGTGGGPGLLCAAAHDGTSGEVFVSCSVNGTEAWGGAILALKGVTTTLGMPIGLVGCPTLGGGFSVSVGGVGSGGDSGVVSATCSIPAGSSECDGAGWVDLPMLPLPGVANDFGMASSRGVAQGGGLMGIAVASVGKSDGAGDELYALGLY